MATVYLARDLKHDRPVALKLLRPEVASALGQDRFRREIRIAANLAHPHILPLHDSGEVDGLVYYVMPYVRGESLRQRLDREHQLPLEEALRITRDVADALGHAHDHGIIHRDIKPENVLLSGSDALVADFGIARPVTAAGHLTESGVAIGTPAYMSPEQLNGQQDLDARTDVYALGCVLHEMLAGEAPFTGSSVYAIASRAMTEAPQSIHSLRPAVPAALDGVIAKALAAAPADRYASMAAFSRAVELAKTAGTTASVGSATVAERPRRQRRVRRALQFGFVAAVGVAALFLRLGRGDTVSGEGPMHLAVIPFENLGAPEQDYFADGMTDEVRGKLAALPGVLVIARSSSTPFKKSTLSHGQIASELGVQYLLTGTVRWDHSATPAPRVHVSAELVSFAGSGAPTLRWHRPFDATMTDVFRVQADIAGQVARALGLALGERERRTLTSPPTQSLAAYDAFVRGEELSGGVSVLNPATLRRAVAYYEQATALDTGFAAAWSQLARARAAIYANSVPSEAAAEAAQRAAERAHALGGRGAEGPLALASYYLAVEGDYRWALAELLEGQRRAPNDAAVLSQMSVIQQGLGQWDSALVNLQRAQVVDPRSVTTARRLATTLLYLRRYPEAMEAAERGLALAPANLDLLQRMAAAHLGRGDLGMARGVIAAVPREVEQTTLVAYFAYFWDLYWVLNDSQQELLLRLSPAAFDDDRAAWGVILAGTAWLRGDTARARVYADSARIALESQLADAPDDAQLHATHALVLAYLGRGAEAISAAEHAVSLAPSSRDAYNGPYYEHQLARVYSLVGERARALETIRSLLSTPYLVSPGWLRIDPNFASLQGDSAFGRLVRGVM